MTDTTNLDTDLLAVEPNAVYTRHLPAGMAVWVVPMIFTYRVCFGAADPGPLGSYDDAWCYHDEPTAVAAAAAWSPLVEKEPSGWHRHPMTGRRRPDGDPTREYIEK